MKGHVPFLKQAVLSWFLLTALFAGQEASAQTSKLEIVAPPPKPPARAKVYSAPKTTTRPVHKGTRRPEAAPSTTEADLRRADVVFDGNDYSTAARLYLAHSDDLDETQQYRLGFLYRNGYGVNQDYAKAKQWYEKAVDKGEAVAMNNLGVLYHNGYGVNQDYAKAKQWYEKAADKGYAGAMTNLGTLYETGSGVAQDYAKARAWYERAAAKGQKVAMRNLGSIFEKGKGFLVDFPRARAWYQKAADLGDEDAKAALKRLEGE